MGLTKQEHAGYFLKALGLLDQEDPIKGESIGFSEEEILERMSRFTPEEEAHALAVAKNLAK